MQEVQMMLARTSLSLSLSLSLSAQVSRSTCCWSAGYLLLT